MAYSDEVRSILQNATEVSDYGLILDHNMDEAAQYLRVVSDRLTMAYNNALVYVNAMDEIIAKMRTVISGGTTSLNAVQALGNFEATREHMDRFRVRVKLHIEKVDALRTVLQLGVSSQDLKDSKQSFLSGVEALRNYLNGIE